MLDALAPRVATRHILAQGEFKVGDPVLFGKYKNKRGVIVRVFDDAKGHPTLEIEPVPKGRKKNKEIGLYKIWHDPNPPGVQPAVGGAQAAEPPGVEDEDDDEDDEEDEDQKQAALTRRVAERYLQATAIKWKRYPGGVANITRTPGGGAYAKSEDGRFLIHVSRYLRGDPGDRSYVYHFSAVDYSIPSGGQRFTNIPVDRGGGFKSDTSTNVKHVMEAVEKWAREHPLPEPKQASNEQWDDHEFDE
jgi:hypothetical protein